MEMVEWWLNWAYMLSVCKAPLIGHHHVIVLEFDGVTDIKKERESKSARQKENHWVGEGDLRAYMFLAQHEEAPLIVACH